ncbi:uncharacterized protein LOC111244629 isoform X2 [Varroa destructor]|nr:uncharacterized protein LOC111244629 isoform X2 [Varroa destructor]
MQGEFNCFRHPQCWMCWFGCKLFHQSVEAWSVMCSPKGREICLEGCQTSCRFHESDNELDDNHPVGPLETQEVVEDVKYQYDLEENTTNIEWDYRPDAQLSGVILVVGTNLSLNDTSLVDPQNLYIIGRTYYRNITIDDTYLDKFCTIRLATVDSEKKISLLNVHTEHLKRHTNRCHSVGAHHHPPIISSIHVTDLHKRYNISDSHFTLTGSHNNRSNNNEQASSATGQTDIIGSEERSRDSNGLRYSGDQSAPQSGFALGNATSINFENRHVLINASDVAIATFTASNAEASIDAGNNSSDSEGASGNKTVSVTPGITHKVSNTFTSQLELFPAPVLISLSRPRPTNYAIHQGPGTHLSLASNGLTGAGIGATADPHLIDGKVGLSSEVLKAAIRWDPFVNSSEDGSCTKYKVTWKAAIVDKVAGDLLTCSTNTSISVERNSVYHVWVSLFGHEQIRTQQLTVETAHAQFAKLHALESCHGCVRGDYTTGVSAALASLIVLAVAVFLLIKSYRSYTLRDHKLHNSVSSFLMPSSLLGELGAKPMMHVIEPKMLNSAVSSSRASAHVTITPIATHGPEEQPSSSLRSNGPYEPLSLEDEDVNYFVFDLPKNHTAV